MFGILCAIYSLIFQWFCKTIEFPKFIKLYPNIMLYIFTNSKLVM